MLLLFQWQSFEKKKNKENKYTKSASGTSRTCPCNTSKNVRFRIAIFSKNILQ